MIPFFVGSLLQASLRKTGTPGTHKFYKRLGGQWVMSGPGQVRNLPNPKHAKLIENEFPILPLWASMGIPSPRLACACTCEITVTLVAFPHLLPPSCTKRGVSLFRLTITATGLEDHLAKLFPFFQQEETSSPGTRKQQHKSILKFQKYLEPFCQTAHVGKTWHVHFGGILTFGDGQHAHQKNRTPSNKKPMVARTFILTDFKWLSLQPSFFNLTIRFGILHFCRTSSFGWDSPKENGTMTCRLIINLATWRSRLDTGMTRRDRCARWWRGRYRLNGDLLKWWLAHMLNCWLANIWWS